MSEINGSTPVDFGQPAQQYAAPSMPVGASYVTPAAPKKSRKGVYLVSALLVVGGLVGLSATHQSKTPSTSSPDTVQNTSFHNLAKLENGVREEAQKLANTNRLGIVDSVLCIKQAGTEYVCNIKMKDGDATTINVTVAADGQSWVSHS